MRAAARRLCRQFGVRIVSKTPGEMETASIKVIAHLIKMHGIENMVLTLRILCETHPANRSQLNRVVITATNAACRLRWSRLGLPFLEAFDSIDLGALHERAMSF